MTRILTALLLCLTAPASADSHTVVSVTVDPSFAAPLRKTDTLVQVGSDTRNRFIMHRVHKPLTITKGVVILLPSLLTSFAEYTIDAGDNTANSLAATLANAGYDVWGYSPRTATLPTHACSSGAVDCSILNTWGIAAYLDDVEYVRQIVSIFHPLKKPVVGGLSLGGDLGIGAVNQHPCDYAGLIMWESMLYSADPTITTLNQANCAADEAQLAAGDYYNEAVQDTALFLLSLGEAASVSLFGNPLPLFGTPTFTVDVATADHAAFAFADFAGRFTRMIQADHSVESNRVIRDINCSLAGERTFTNNLGAFHGPVFAIEGGQSYGPYMGDNLALFPGAKTISSTAAFGHADAYLTASHATYIEGPLLSWLSSVF